MQRVVSMGSHGELTALGICEPAALIYAATVSPTRAGKSHEVLAFSLSSALVSSSVATVSKLQTVATHLLTFLRPPLRYLDASLPADCMHFLASAVAAP